MKLQLFCWLLAISTASLLVFNDTGYSRRKGKADGSACNSNRECKSNHCEKNSKGKKECKSKSSTSKKMGHSTHKKTSSPSHMGKNKKGSSAPKRSSSPSYGRKNKKGSSAPKRTSSPSYGRKNKKGSSAPKRTSSPSRGRKNKRDNSTPKDTSSPDNSKDKATGAAAKFSLPKLADSKGGVLKKYAHKANCPQGQNTSPGIKPTGANGAEYFMIMEDTTAGWLHWVVQFQSSLSEGGKGTKQGTNDFKEKGWGGPSSPGSKHNYKFTLYTLQSKLGSSWNVASTMDLERELQNKNITYGKSEVSVPLGPCN